MSVRALLRSAASFWGVQERQKVRHFDPQSTAKRLQFDHVDAALPALAFADISLFIPDFAGKIGLRQSGILADLPQNSQERRVLNRM